MSGQTIKWPFDAEKRDYEVWDGMVSHLVPATFEGEDEIDGLDTYRYQVNVSEVPVELTEGVDGFYAGSTTYWGTARRRAAVAARRTAGAHRGRRDSDYQPYKSVV